LIEWLVAVRSLSGRRFLLSVTSAPLSSVARAQDAFTTEPKGLVLDTLDRDLQAALFREMAHVAAVDVITTPSSSSITLANDWIISPPRGDSLNFLPPASAGAPTGWRGVLDFPAGLRI